MLRHHELPDHTAGFAHVNLMRPVIVVRKLVLGQAPLAHGRPHLFGDARVVGHEIHQALLIPFVLADDLTATCIRCLGVIVVVADVVGAEGTVIVGIGFPIGNRIKLLEMFPPSRVEDSQQQFVLRGS